MPAAPGAIVGIGDDAAVLRVPDPRIVATTDLLVEGRHFRTEWSGPADIGGKAAARSLADVAAMGAVPLGETWLDQALGGGLRADGLHEFHAAGVPDVIAAIGFSLLVARLRRELDHRPLIWARQDDALGQPYGGGLVAPYLAGRKWHTLQLLVSTA